MAAAPDNEAIAIPIKVVPNAPIALKVPASTLAAANLNVATATIVLATLFGSCGIAEAIESKTSSISSSSFSLAGLSGVSALRSNTKTDMAAWS
jgi:hypothetical protein